MLPFKWLHFLLTLLTVFKANGKLWGKTANQASIDRLLERTKALHFDSFESENSVLDSDNARLNGTFYEKIGQIDSTTNSPTPAASPSNSESYFNLKKSRPKPSETSFPVNESQSTADTIISLDASLQGNDQPAALDISPDERTIQNVIRETIPKLTRKQDRWLGPILSAAPDSRPIVNQTSNWNRLEPLSPNQFSAAQQLQTPWMRVLNTSLTAKTSPMLMSSTTMEPSFEITGAKQKGPGFRGTRTNASPFLAGAQNQQIPSIKESGASFLVTTESPLSLWGSMKTNQPEVPLLVPELRATTQRTVLDRSNHMLSQAKHSSAHLGENNRNLMRQQAEVIMLNPLAFSTTNNQLDLTKIRPLDIQPPSPINWTLNSTPEQRPDLSSQKTANHGQLLTMHQMSHNPTHGPPKPSQRSSGFRRRTPPPFYGYDRNTLHHPLVGSKKDLVVTTQETVQQFRNTIPLTFEATTISMKKPNLQMYGNQELTTQSSSSLESSLNVASDYPSLRQSTPFVCPCMVTEKGTGIGYTTNPMVQAGYQTSSGNFQTATRDPRGFNQGNMNGKQFGNSNTAGNYAYQNPANGLQSAINSVYQTQANGLNGGYPEVSRLAVGPDITNNFGSSSGNKQLGIQVPLTDIFGQPIQTTTPSQWQPFTPRWSTTELFDPPKINMNQITMVGGNNKQLQLTNPTGGNRAELQMQRDKSSATNSASTMYAENSATQIMDQQAVTSSYTGGKPLFMVTGPMGLFSYGTSQTTASTLGTIAGSQYLPVGSDGSSSTIPICPNGSTITQPPITVDIIQPIRRLLLNSGKIGPVCLKSLVEVQLDGRTLAGTIIGTVLATDTGSNMLLWSIERDVTGAFGIGKFSGDFSLTGTLNGINAAEVEIRATNPAGQFCTTVVQVTVIRPQNSSGGPKSANWFSQDVYNATVLCSLPIGTLIMQATARHPRGDLLRYSLDSTREFAVNDTGFVSVTGLDVGQQQDTLRSFRIIATDSQGVQSSSLIEVFLDISTCYGPQFEMSAYIYDVGADCSGVRPTDQIAQINALPPSPLSQLSYRLIGTIGFLVDPMSGIISSLAPIEVSQRLPDFGIVVSDAYGRTDTATVRISVIINCTQPRTSPFNDLPVSIDAQKKHQKKNLSGLERQRSNIGDFLLRVACNAPNGTIIGTLNPTVLLSLEDAVPDLHLENTTDFAISMDGEIMTQNDMPSENKSSNFHLVGDGSKFGLGLIVGNITIQVVCSSESSVKKSLENPSTTLVMESSTFPFIPLKAFDDT